MPSKSAAQARLMAAVAHNPASAKKVGISQSVGREFNQADKGRTFKEGGITMATKGKNPFAAFEKSGKDKEPKGMTEGSKKEEAFDKKQMKFAKGGSIDGVAQRGKTKGTQVKMSCGGKVKK